MMKKETINAQNFAALENFKEVKQEQLETVVGGDYCKDFNCIFAKILFGKK